MQRQALTKSSSTRRRHIVDWLTTPLDRGRFRPTLLYCILFDPLFSDWKSFEKSEATRFFSVSSISKRIAMSYQFCVMGIAKRKWVHSNSLPVRYCFRKGKFFVLKDASSKSGRWIAMGPDRYTQVNYAILGLSRFRFPSSLSWLVILRYICLSTWNPNNLPT